MAAKEIAENIKAQRKHRNVMNQNEFDDDDEKDQVIINEALARMSKRGKSNIKKFLFDMMYVHVKDDHKQDKTDEKQENNKKEKKKYENVSQLIDMTHKEMCKYGHGEWRDDGSMKEYIQDAECIMCGSMKERAYCRDCAYYDKCQTGKEYATTAPCHTYCSECRVRNGINIKEIVAKDNFIAGIIREELLNNPSLEMDLLCNMPRKASLFTLMNDINRLDDQDKGKCAVFMMDLDNLKAWNSCLGHEYADQLIIKIGNIMKKYVQQINDGMWSDLDKGRLKKAFIYRTGGDEFVMAIQCNNYAAMYCEFGEFYFEMKKEINELGGHIEDFFVNEKDEWKETEQKLGDAKDRNGNKVNMNIVGISTGIYVPKVPAKKGKDWLLIADKVALEHAKSINVPDKNSVAIYYEDIDGLIADDKVSKCLEMGVYPESESESDSDL